MANKEQVLVFPAKLLRELGEFEGVSREINKYLYDILFPANLQYMDRETAENNPEFKQIIPYCVFKVGGLYFTYQRTKMAGENRLHGKYSVGVGGHINPVDGELKEGGDFYRLAFKRELEEEISLKGDYSERIIGILYDPSNDVGKVHFGIVHLVEAPLGTCVESNDPSMANCHWSSVSPMLKNLSNFENWSQLVIQELLPVEEAKA